MPEWLIQDLRFAVRTLRRSPLFTCAAILTFALGIGANTAIFSIIDQTLFRPLSFPQPGQLADVFAFNKSSQKFLSSSLPDYLDLRARSRTFEQLSAFVRMPLSVSLDGRTERLPVEAVTANFFAMLRLAPIAGREFGEDEDSDSAGRVAMISEELGGAARVGQTIRIEDEPFTVVGLVAKSYHGTNLNWGDPPRVWIPLRATAIAFPRFRTMDIFRQRSMQWLLLTGRMKPGVTANQAQAEIQTIMASIASAHPATNQDLSALVYPASRAKFWPSYRESITRSLMAFAVAAALLLVLTCANLSNLLLGRALGRGREFAIRLSIGAGRERILRQMLAESFAIAAPGCAAAIAIAYGLGRILIRFPNALGLPLALDATIEGRVLVFCTILTCCATLLFGIAPAIRATQTGVLPALKESGNAVTATAGSLRRILLVVQISFSTVLLAGGGLFVHSVMHALSIDLGFQPERLLTGGFTVPASSEGAERMRTSQSEWLAKLRSTPGVEAATVASEQPLDHILTNTSVQADAATVQADRHTVGSDFFRTLRVPMLRGREFDARDGRDSTKVAIVSRGLAAKLWPRGDAIGRVVRVRDREFRVIGVVADAHLTSIWDEPRPTLFTPQAQSDSAANAWIVRAPGVPFPVLERQWQQLFAQSPLYGIQTGGEMLKTALGPQRMAAGIFGAFGLLAIVLSAVGLYGSMAYAVSRRTREIGIRMAIGARPDDVTREVLGGTMALAAAGIGCGLIVSLWLARYLPAQVPGIPVYDWIAFAGVAALQLAVVLGAALVPARRAMRIDPQAALRSE